MIIKALCIIMLEDITFLQYLNDYYNKNTFKVQDGKKEV